MFRLAYRGRAVTLVLRDGFVTATMAAIATPIPAFAAVAAAPGTIPRSMLRPRRAKARSLLVSSLDRLAACGVLQRHAPTLGEASRP